MPAAKDIAHSIDRALSFITAQQQEDGSFITQSVPLQATSSVGTYAYRATFTNAHILHSLSQLRQHAVASKVADKLASFLLKQKSDHWSFNYWARDAAEENTTMPYPDDLDDTFCATASLYQHNPEYLDGEAMADIVSVLTHAEVEVGGPYKTWLVEANAPDIWQDIDLAVNANIAYALRLHDIELPELTKLMDQAIATNTYTSPYYPHRIPLLYFIARAYQGKHRASLIAHIHQALKEPWVRAEPLYSSLMLSALLRLGDASKSIHHELHEELISAQVEDGSWPAAPFCIDPSHEGIRYTAQAEVLTTSMCLEAIASFQARYDTQAPSKKTSKAPEKITRAVVAKIQQKFASLDKDAQLLGLKILEETLDGDTDSQIVLMPWFTAMSVREGDRIDQDLITSLGAASTYGWIAYTIYDDVLDGELLDPARISLANICLRELTLIFHQVLPAASGFHNIVSSTLDHLDSINAWEVLNTRYRPSDMISLSELPNYGDYSCLAQRSLGHALGPLAILIATGIPGDHPDIKHLHEFFKHAIIARQLNDDAHDWEDDLSRGHMTAVNTMIASIVLTGSNDMSFEQFTAGKSTVLREIFWDEVAPVVCGQMQKHVSLAKQALEAMTCLADRRLCEAILTKPEKAAQQALKEREQTLEFIAAYAN